MSAVANAVPSSSRTAPNRSIDDLDAAICRLASRVNAVNYRLLTLVREFDDRLGWAKWNFPGCAEWLAWRCGLSVSAAREKVRTAQALRDLPSISLAFREGRLSYTKVRALTRVAALHGEDSLLRYALDATAPQVEERCRQIRNVQPESAHDARRAWAARSLSAWRNTERGTLCLRAEFPLEVGDLVMRAIERALEQEEVADGVAEASSSSFHAQQADALVAIVTTYLHGGATEQGPEAVSTPDRYQVVVHVDETALGTPLSVGRKQRTVSTPIRRALFARDRHCTFPGCHRTRFVAAHHVHHWTEGGRCRHEDANRANPSMEVREPRGMYRLSC